MKINGIFVTQGPPSGYHFHYHWNRVDVTDLLIEGENTVELHVYYQGMVNFPWNSGDLHMGFAFALYGEKDGCSTLITEVDETWVYALSKAYLPAHTFVYNTQYAEYFDARLATPDLRDYRPRVVVKNGYTFAPEPVPTLQIYDRKPAKVIRHPDGSLLCDMVEEVTGAFVLRVRGKAGTKLHISCGEELESGDFCATARVRSHTRCYCDCNDYIILSGRGSIRGT